MDVNEKNFFFLGGGGGVNEELKFLCKFKKKIGGGSGGWGWGGQGG